MKKLSIFAIAAILMVILVPAAWGQMGTVKGAIKDTEGKPIAGASVELVDKNTGHKYTLKSDKGGNIFSLGIAAGTYDVTVKNSSGVDVFKSGGFPVRPGDENALNIDLKQEAQKQAEQMSPEQKKAIEQQNAERTKIKGLNDMLAQGVAAEKAGDFDGAAKIYQQATQVDPNRELLWAKLADAQRQGALKNADAEAKKTGLEASLQSYDKALKLTPNTKPDVMGAIYNNMGEAYAKLGQTDQAVKAYDSAAGADPTKAGQYYFNEGAVLTNTNHYKEANAAFDKSIQADPTRAAAYYWKGSNGVNLATLDKEGKMVPAPGTEEAFNKYLELEPNGQMAEQAKAMLQALGAKVETSYGKGKTAAKKK
jgi:tetratricopeptide (TPR) repeat protein